MHFHVFQPADDIFLFNGVMEKARGLHALIVSRVPSEAMAGSGSLRLPLRFAPVSLDGFAACASGRVAAVHGTFEPRRSTKLLA